MADSLHSSLLIAEEQEQDNINGNGCEDVSRKSDLDISAITSFQSFRKESWIESKKLWAIAGPAIFTTLCNYSIAAISQTFAGQLGTVNQAAVAIGNSVISTLAFGIMLANHSEVFAELHDSPVEAALIGWLYRLANHSEVFAELHDSPVEAALIGWLYRLGMGSALETLCGQAFGAGQIDMLGVYMQRSWIILFCTALPLTLVYIFATPILKVLGQNADVADLAGRFAVWLIPQLFAFPFIFPMQKFLQAQRKVMAMAWIAFFGLVIHVILSWLLIFKLGLGLLGVAIPLNVSWWIVDIGQFLYIVYFCKDAWRGFSWLAFQDIWAFVRLSMASAIMLCLEFWYMMSLTIMTGHLKDAAVEVDALSVCMTLNGWEAMIFIGFNAGISVRISNELGAGHPGAAKFAVLIVTITSLSIGLVCMCIIIATKDDFAVLFTNSAAVMTKVSNMAILLAVTMLLNSVQPVLSGVAVGGGWQALIAYVNIGCYYVIGVPLGLLMGYKFDLGAKGIWTGMICGTALQTIILILITYYTDWNKEVAQAKDRLELWGGSDGPPTKEEHNAENHVVSQQ